jgi:MscS family membrane protein
MGTVKVLSLAVRLTIALAIVLVLSLPAAGQIPGTATQPPAPAETVVDPLGRETPSGTIRGFNAAVRRDDLASARLYMQLTPAQRGSANQLATQLNELIDRYLFEPLAALSRSPSGQANDGLPLDRERIQLTIEGTPQDVVLVRVTDPQAGLIWLISSGSLAQVPLLYESAQDLWIERIMPDVLVRSRLFGMSLARWLAYLGSLLLPLAGLRLLATVVMAGLRRAITDPGRRVLLEGWYAGLKRLLVVVLAVLIHLMLMRYLGFSLSFRYAYTRVALMAFVVAAAWLVSRFLTLLIAQARLLAQRRGESGFSSLLMLAERVGKAVVTLVAIFVILSLAGVDTSTALAGVGIGGVAVALGAQKTVENLLGGVFLISDKALAVGDECRIADRIGKVEDITLRSVRLRTVEQTLLSIPAGALSQAHIENFSTRGKIPVQTRLRLRYETTATQLRAVLDGVRRVLAEYPEIEAPTSRIRLVDFGAQAVELELFAYVLTAELNRFLAVREDLLLSIADIVESAGTTFAHPTEFLFLGDQRHTAGEPQEVVHAQRPVSRPAG